MEHSVSETQWIAMLHVPYNRIIATITNDESKLTHSRRFTPPATLLILQSPWHTATGSHHNWKRSGSEKQPTPWKHPTSLCPSKARGSINVLKTFIRLPVPAQKTWLTHQADWADNHWGYPQIQPRLSGDLHLSLWNPRTNKQSSISNKI